MQPLNLCSASILRANSLPLSNKTFANLLIVTIDSSEGCLIQLGSCEKNVPNQSSLHHHLNGNIHPTHTIFRPQTHFGCRVTFRCVYHTSETATFRHTCRLDAPPSADRTRCQEGSNRHRRIRSTRAGVDIARFWRREFTDCESSPPGLLSSLCLSRIH